METTLAINAQITIIVNGEVTTIDKREVAKLIKKALNADDVTVSCVKVFERSENEH